MRSMEDMLLEYPEINKRIFKLNEDLQIAVKAQLNADGGIKASIISDMPHGTGVGNPTYEKTANLFEHLEEICIELAELAEYTKFQIQQLSDEKKEIDYALMYLTHAEKRVIELRYWIYTAPKYNWNKVISEMAGYCDREVYRIHKKAMEKLNLSVNVSKMAV